jgi:sulfur-oxidizing protein SoxX
MLNKTTIMTALAATTTMLLVAGGTAIGADYTKMSPEELAEYLIYETKSFKLDLPAQEGGTAGGRLVQDQLQKICSALRDKPIDSSTAARVNAMARESIKYPEGGIKLGDWKKGRALAWSGFGYRVGHRNDDHGKRETGANCYNCHQLATDRTGGTIGPALTNYGARGTSEPILKYTYEVIYNPHAYFPCTYMPRMGANGVLSADQISHVMAYLLDPESPVNSGKAP